MRALSARLSEGPICTSYVPDAGIHGFAFVVAIVVFKTKNYPRTKTRDGGGGKERERDQRERDMRDVKRIKTETRPPVKNNDRIGQSKFTVV